MYGTGVNFGLLESLRNVPTPMDGYNEAAKTNLTNAQANWANTQSQNSQQDLAIKKMETVNKLAGSLVMNPTQENLTAIKKMASQAGLDVSSIPDDLNSALPFAKNAYASSGQALEMWKAQSQIEMARATLGLKATDTAANVQRLNMDATEKAIIQPGQSLMPGYSGSSAMGGQSAGGIQGFPSIGIPVMPGQNQSSTGNPTYQSQAGLDYPVTNQRGLEASATALPTAGQSYPISVTGTVGNGGNYAPSTPAGVAQQQMPAQQATSSAQTNPSLAGSGVMFPAERKGEEKQAENWQEFKKSTVSAAQSYGTNKNVINTIRTVNDGRGMTGNFAGFLPKSYLENTEEGQFIGKDGARLMLGVIANLSASGIHRLDIPIVNQALQSVPQITKNTRVNDNILDKTEAANEVASNIAPKVIENLDKAGVRDPLAAQSIINQVLERTGIYDEKNGRIDLQRLNNWEQHYKDVLNPPTTVINGKPVNYNEFFTKVKKANPGESGDEIKQLWNQQYAPQSNQQVSANDQPNQGTPMMLAQAAGAPSPQMQEASQQAPGATTKNSNPTFQAAMQVAPRLAEAIAHGIESGGNYNAIGSVTSNGDRAYGKHQIMGNNIPSWTREILGKAMTPREFLANPQAQDRVAQVKLAQYITQTGSLENAAAMWFSGKPLHGNNRRDMHGTSAPGYINAVGRKYASMR